MMPFRSHVSTTRLVTAGVPRASRCALRTPPRAANAGAFANRLRALHNEAGGKNATRSSQGFPANTSHGILRLLRAPTGNTLVGGTVFPCALPRTTRLDHLTKGRAAYSTEAKNTEGMAGEAKTTEAKAAEPKADEAKTAEADAVRANAAEITTPEAKADETNAAESKGVEAKTAEADAVGANAAETNTTEAKADEAKADEAEADETSAAGAKRAAQPEGIEVTQGARHILHRVFEAGAPGEPTIHAVWEESRASWQYVVADPKTSTAVIIDPVLFMEDCGRALRTSPSDQLLKVVKDRGYKVDMILETHIHADHITGASYLQKCLAEEQGYKPRIGIGKRVVQVQKKICERYDIPIEETAGAFDVLFDDDETFSIGELKAMAIHLPGHACEQVGYHVGGTIGDNVFAGDAIAHVDRGEPRCNLPGGSPRHFYASLHKLAALRNNTRLWYGHDHPAKSRGPVAWLPVGHIKKKNIVLMKQITEEKFVKQKKVLDANLKKLKLFYPSLQMNVRAGRLPTANAHGKRFLYIPLALKDEAAAW